MLSFNCCYNVHPVAFSQTSLFTKVPVDDLLNFLKEELDNMNLPLPTSTVIDLIKLCIKDCKFVFDDKFYSQKIGMAMGNPLSPLLSNLYMEFFESKILKNILPANVVWYRYVDDIFCIWPGNKNLDNILLLLNNLVPSIKFTIEIEQNFSLPFLDVIVHRQSNNFKFSIYRKPTNVCSYVHYYSAHHDKVKRSVFSSMFLRALRICSPEFMDDEINKIYEISVKLKYPKSFVDSSLRKAKKTFYSNGEKEPYCNKNMLVLPFHENFVNITCLLKELDINVVFKNENIMKNMLIKNSPNNVSGCVYRIPCKLCNKSYVGQTGKELNIRIKQHKYSIKTGQESNALFIHLRDFNHPIDWDHAQQIVYSKSVFDRNIIESSIIKHNMNLIVNLSSGLYKLDPIIIRKIASMFNLV